MWGSTQELSHAPCQGWNEGNDAQRFTDSHPPTQASRHTCTRTHTLFKCPLTGTGPNCTPMLPWQWTNVNLVNGKNDLSLCRSPQRQLRERAAEAVVFKVPVSQALMDLPWALFLPHRVTYCDFPAHGLWRWGNSAWVLLSALGLISLFAVAQILAVNQGSNFHVDGNLRLSFSHSQNSSMLGIRNSITHREGCRLHR